MIKFLAWMDKYYWHFACVFYAYMFARLYQAELGTFSIVLLCICIPLDIHKLINDVKKNRHERLQ